MSESSNARIARGATIILIANVVNMLISIITNFILPQNLSTDTYASIKLYQLYLSYVGILHFGAVDGIYLRYGGKHLSTLGREEIGKSLSTFRCFQILIVVVGIIVSLFAKDMILLVVSFMVLPTNMLSYYKYLYQACGEFKAYSRILNIVTIGMFIVNMGLVLVIKSDNYIPYIVGYLLVNALMLIYTEISFSKRYDVPLKNQKNLSVSALVYDMRNGILLTLGNFASILMTSMDRWFVKIFIGTTAFAQYAFAVSIENFLNTAATPVTITFYNGFCTDDSLEKIQMLRKCVMFLSALLVSSAFAIKFITEIYLTKYQDAVNVMFYLFAAQFFYVVIKSIYNNLYKVRKKQSIYFTKLLVSLVAGFVFNLIGYYLYNVKESYAIATLCSAVFWLIIVLFDFNMEERLSMKEWAFMALVSTALLVFGKVVSSIVGFVLYLFVVVVVAEIFLEDTVKKMLSFAIRNVKNIFKKHIT